MKNRKRIGIKVVAASLAFVPAALLFSGLFPRGSAIENGLLIFNFPALGICHSADMVFHLKTFTATVCLIVCMLMWASLVGWVFWKITAAFLGEDEPEFETNPERAKFDWDAFWVRFAIGFVVGFLIGWRWGFVRNSSSKATVLIALTVTGLFFGLAYGLYRPNFWSR